MDEQATPKKAVDWERVEAQFCAGTMSLREICKAHGDAITEGAIRKRAKKNGWARDLTAKVKAKADEIVRRDTVRAESAENLTPTELETVQVEAHIQARVRLSHRTDIQRSKRIANALLEHLEGIGLPPLPGADKPESEKHGARALSVATLKEQALVLDKLVGTQKALVAMEREAYGIAQMVDPEDAAPALDPMEGARRLAFVLSRASAQLTGASNG
jgi:hypothetical protein